MKVYEMNDCEWWMAATLEEAKAAYIAAFGPDSHEEIKDARELTEEELDKLTFYEGGKDEEGDAVAYSFRERLAKLTNLVPCEAQFFATTEH